MVEQNKEITPMDLNLPGCFTFITGFSSVISSIRIGLFDFLDNKDYLSITEIKSGLNLEIKDRNFVDFLDILYCNKHLLRENVGLEAKYKLRHRFYVKSNPFNLCMMMMMMDRIMKETDLVDNALRTGKASLDKGNIFDRLYNNPEAAEAFLNTMGLIQMPNFIQISNKLDFSKYKTVVDVGGCLGNFLVTVKQKFSHLECTNFDLPFVEQHFKKFIKSQGLEDQIKFQAGDFFKDDLPKSDVIVMGNILHDWSDEKKKILVKKAYESLNQNGIFIIVEKPVNETRDSLEDGLVISYVMLMEVVEGFNMTKSEISNYAKEVGFDKTEYLDDLCGAEGAICYK
jgi:hypothetical protein